MKELIIPQINQNESLFSTLKTRIAFAKERVEALESLRMQRALVENSAGFQTVLSLLPALLHYNEPNLIGYVENAPCGFSPFQINAVAQDFLDSLAIEQVTSPDAFAFDGLYVMGSFGSVTQTTLSDLDLWLCHTTVLSPTQQQALSEKLSLIQHWAKEFGVELQFYLMNPTHFKAQQYNSDVTTEHSGSAQHFFLLDEFYRSAIRLAGKRVLWLHLNEEDYRQVTQRPDFDFSDWIDFGDLSSLSIGEYFGASLWQLYKGIKNPYKSAIKILLLESYAQTYPATPLISVKFKQKLFSTNSVQYHFDPYLAMLEQATEYLEQRKEFGRLDRLRYCFYLKAIEGQQTTWRIHYLHRLAKSWGWADSELHRLACRKSWKVKQAMADQQMLVEQLLQSYRNLIHFARKFHIDPSIMPQDTDILMRKLYSVFEVLPGKVTLINEKIATDLAENEVTFVEVLESSTQRSGWYLINHAPLSPYDSAKRYVQYQKSLTKLVAWAYFNGVVTVNTQLHIVSQRVSLARLRKFIADVRLTFPVKPPPMQDEDLYHPNEIRNLIVAVNLTNDPTHQLEAQTALSQVDLFNLSSSEQGIVGSISLIYRNMWNEVIAQHFEGADAILKALKLISNKIYRSSAPPESVNVFCYSTQLRNELQKFVVSLVNRCISVQTGVISQKQHSHPFNLAGKRWRFIFGKQVELKEVPNEKNVSEDNTLAVPAEIYNFASEGFLQFFFEDNADQSFNVYVLDKRNHIESYRQCVGSKAEKIKQINRLYAEGENEHDCCSLESFNFPQFYQLILQPEGMVIVPFQSKQHREYLAHKSQTKTCLDQILM